MARWHFDPQDTDAQRSILRRSAVAQRTRERFPAGTRVQGRFGPQLTGTVLRHVPDTSSQGGMLTIAWDTGAVGRVGPITVEAVNV